MNRIIINSGGDDHILSVKYSSRKAAEKDIKEMNLPNYVNVWIIRNSDVVEEDDDYAVYRTPLGLRNAVVENNEYNGDDNCD